MKKTTVAALLLLALPAFTACQSSDKPTNTVANSSTSETSETSDGAAAAAAATSAPASSDTTTDDSASSEPSSSESLTKEFGSTFTWDDKLAVTVSKPMPFKPSEYSYTEKKFSKFVVMTVTIKNGTSKVYEAMSMNFSGTSGDQQTDQVFDSANGLELPSAKVLPGKTLTFKIGYGITPGQEFVLTVNSMDEFDRADGIYRIKL